VEKQLLETAADIFSNARDHSAEADDQMSAELYQQVGKLQVELDWLKKESGLSC
jgi:hypothetical protein